MTMLRRHKYVLTVLLIYWPAIFILTHMPVPDMARKTGMSDKTMHLLAYLLLVFLWWFAISPYKKADWRKAKPWLTLALMVLYGAFDEWLQLFIQGRTAAVADFIADLAGTVLGLLILSIFTFWHGLLIVTAIFIFAATNLSDIVLLYPHLHLNISFHFFAYAVFTLMWIQYMHRYIPTKDTTPKWLITALAAPLSLLMFVKLCSIPFAKQIRLIDSLTAFTAIAAAIIVSYFTCNPRRKPPP